MRKFMASIQMEVFAESESEAREIVRRSLVKKTNEAFVLVEVAARTERCAICELTYVPSEVVEIKGESLCVFCRLDKYGRGELSAEDIPF